MYSMLFPRAVAKYRYYRIRSLDRRRLPDPVGMLDDVRWMWWVIYRPFHSCTSIYLNLWEGGEGKIGGGGEMLGRPIGTWEMCVLRPCSDEHFVTRLSTAPWSRNIAVADSLERVSSVDTLSMLVPPLCISFPASFFFPSTFTSCIDVVVHDTGGWKS
jgi:hypothetical protein